MWRKREWVELRFFSALLVDMGTFFRKMSIFAEEVPFEINRLAMFRPPSRTRLSRDRRSNTVPAQGCVF